MLCVGVLDVLRVCSECMWLVVSDDGDGVECVNV